MEGRIRAFLCIELPEFIRRSIGKAEEPLRSKRPELKWVHEKNLHITLKFCGECPPGIVEEFAASYGKFCGSESLSPFSLTLGSPGALPSLSRMSTLYAGLQGQLQSLSAAAERAGEAAEKSGMERNTRLFLPHITLARARTPLRLFREELPEFPPLDWTVNSIVLMKSTLRPAGPEYSPLFTWPLGNIKE